MTLSQIKKRNGDIVAFNRARIEHAIRKACSATGVQCDFASQLTDDIIADLAESFDTQPVADHHHIPTVEQIQDCVERHLVRINQYDVAKAYILYRRERQQERKERHEELVQQFENKELTVQKSDGKREVFDIRKIKRVFDRSADEYKEECTFKEFIAAFKKNLVEGIKTEDINKLMVKTCIDLVSVNNTAWQHVAARIALGDIYKKARRARGLSMREIYTPRSFVALFDEYIEKGLYYKDFYKYYTKEQIMTAARHLSRATDHSYEYTTILSLTKRYLLKDGEEFKELPQEMYMAVALFLAIPEPEETRLDFALKIYEHCSQQHISLPTPTLLNARTNYHQLSSCFKMSIDDDLRAIYHGVENMAQISKFGGGVGVYLGHIRARGAAIRGVSGASGGVNPWIKVINDTAIAVNQLGARMGAISVTLDIWHYDIHDFLDLQTETGDIRSKAFDVFPAVTIPDLFMQRLKNDEQWTLFDPHEVYTVYGKRLEDHFGEEFTAFYEKLERSRSLKMRKTVAAKELFKKFLRTTVETGMPYVFFRDTVNRLNPNAHAGAIYSTQLCTEICQNTSPTTFVRETLEDGEIVIRYAPGDLVVCNLASINVAKVCNEKTIAAVFPVVMRVLDNVITLNYYPIEEAHRTAMRYRSVGLGYLGLAEYLATRKLSYESEEARAKVDALFERYTYHTYRASVDLAKERGAYQLCEGSDYKKGILLGKDVSWFTEKNPRRAKAWEKLFDDMRLYGTRFAYHTAPAPNTSTSGVVGTTAALLPIYKRYFVETNLSSPTVRVAPKLGKDNFWYYKEYISMDMKDVIDMIATIYPWVDQSISFEWMIDPARTSPSQLYGYYLYAWEKGIKTVYYVRSLSGEVDQNVCTSCSG